MNFFVFIFLALLALATIGLLAVFYAVGKGVRFFRRFSSGDLSDEDFQRMANKYYRRSDDARQRFSDDYFKGSDGKRQQPGEAPAKGAQRQRGPARTTAGGVTIEDRRAPGQAGKKIFAHDEGEYVDFTEN